ncbi:MAG: hypothetical protein MOGMAGMI_00450 [Candidatus Omnitrophica bacterium]|nr:hypothetical protein [Candidatus Omnitrophota bacterium]
MIPARDAEAYLAETLDSVRACRGLDPQVIVVDDGSTDRTAELVRDDYPEVELIRTEPLGTSRARRTGTERARGTYLKYLDADDLLDPDGLRAEIVALEGGDADVALGEWTYWYQPVPGGPFRAGRTRRELPEGPWDAAIASGVWWCPQAAYLLRRSSLDRTGVTWDDRFLNIQDCVFLFDLASRGCRWTATRRRSAYYRLHPNNISVRSRQRQALESAAHVRHAESVWAGRMDDHRRRCLVNAYLQSAITVSRFDVRCMRECIARARALEASCLPHGSPRLQVLARWVGLERALLWTAPFRREHPLHKPV